MYAEATFIGGPMDGKIVALEHEPQSIMSVVGFDPESAINDPDGTIKTINHEYTYSNLNESGIHVYSYSGPN